jgi:hypothetical protein
MISQSELNYLLRDLNFPENQAKLLGSKLQGLPPLVKSTKETLFHKCQKFVSIDLVFCSDVNDLMKALGQELKPDERHLFLIKAEF